MLSKYKLGRTLLSMMIKDNKVSLKVIVLLRKVHFLKVKQKGWLDYYLKVEIAIKMMVWLMNLIKIKMDI